MTTTMNRELPYINAFGTVDISSSTNVNEALNLAGLDWEVQSKPIYDEHGNPYEGFRANVNSENGNLLSVVSKSYQIVQNKTAFEFVDNLTDDGFKFDRAGSFRDGRAIWVMGKLPETEILGDKIDNNIVFINSHDGSHGVKVLMTPIRLACYNMLNLAIKRASRSWSTKHTRSVFNRMEEAKYTLGLAQKYIQELDVTADILANKKITDDQLANILDYMFPVNEEKDTERKINNISILKKNFFACYNEADIAKFKGTVWGAVNAMADLVDHSAPMRNTANYYNNAWSKLVQGHPVMDKFYLNVSK